MVLVDAKKLKFMLKVFAKHNTDEKIAVFCHPNQTRDLQIQFSKEFGGDWLLVDEVMTSGEILKFNDGQKYLGFDCSKPIDFRYSAAIVQFKFKREL